MLLSVDPLDHLRTYIISRHHAKIAAMPTRTRRAPQAEREAVSRWVVAFQTAVSAGRTPTIRSLAALASKRAAGIDKAVGRARATDYRQALGAAKDGDYTQTRPPSTRNPRGWRSDLCVARVVGPARRWQMRASTTRCLTPMTQMAVLSMVATIACMPTAPGARSLRRFLSRVH